MPPTNALDSGNPDGDDESTKATKLAARSARFNQVLVGNRYKELEEARVQERKAFENQGLIRTGKTELDDAVDMRGSCERMCSDYEREFREYTREVHHFEARSGDLKRMDPEKAVAAYTRSDAGAGLGDAAILPSDLRTPATLVRTLDYLINRILPTPPRQGPPTPRRALGNTAGFIRDRTRAIRKEFAMQSAWGHDEAISTFERIARWHILCLRELQEEGGMNTDMHIDSAELGRCFTSLRQQYNDRREETGLELPCPNEPEFRAYMLIFDLTSKSVSIPTSELPTVILDHPLVKLAWALRQAAQRNFDSQKEGSKLNAELGMNAITRYVRILKDGNLPFLFACLVEIRLREMRRSALRALTRTYPRLKGEPVRMNEMGEVVERKMVLVETLAGLLGCEEQEEVEGAWDDVELGDTRRETEVVQIARRFDLEVYEDETGPIGVVINLSSPFNDNRDAPYTRRWKSITAKRGDLAYADIVNGKAGIHVDGTAATTTQATKSIPVASTSASLFSRISAAPKGITAPSFSFGKSRTAGDPAPVLSTIVTTPTTIPAIPTINLTPAPSAAATLPVTAPPAAKPSFFSSFFGGSKSTETSATANAPPTASAPSQQIQIPSFAFTAPTPAVSLEATPAKSPAHAPLFSKPSFFSTPAVAGPSSPPRVPSAPMDQTQSSPPQPVQPPITIPTSPGIHQNIATTSLSSSLSRSTRRPTLSTSERLRQRAQIPHVTNDLINSTIQQLLDGMTSDFLRLVKQEKAARDYLKQKEYRKAEIGRMSTRVFEKMREEVVEDLVRDALIVELRRKGLGRKVGRKWKKWARERREDREDLKRIREETFEKMMGLGLGGSSTGNLGVEGGVFGDREEERLDEFEVDVALQQAERNKDHFFSPTTFLSTLANHVAPLLSASRHPTANFHSSPFPVDQRSSSAKRFHTLLSVPSPPANRPDETASKWLEGKFKPRSESGDAEDDEDEEGYESGGARFTVDVLDRYEESAGIGGEWTGLCVFVAPLKSEDGDDDANIQDAQDRMAVLARTTMERDARYTPGLLILVWENEALEDVIGRLQLEDDVQFFANISLLTLDKPDDLDVRFGKAVEAAIPDVGEKVQLVIQLKDVLGRLLPLWQRYLDIANLVLEQRSSDASLTLTVFRQGINGINEIGQTVKAVLKGAQIIPASRIGLTILSEIPTKVVVSNAEVIETIEEYLDTDIFKGVNDLFLSVTPLRQAALTGHSLPITSILSAIARLILSDLIPQTILLKAFYAPPLPAHIPQGLLNSVAMLYESHIDGYIGSITQLPPSPASSPSKEGTRGVKRDRREEERESKASKNARLKRALEEVERSLGGVEMDGGGEMSKVM